TLDVRAVRTAGGIHGRPLATDPEHPANAQVSVLEQQHARPCQPVNAAVPNWIWCWLGFSGLFVEGIHQICDFIVYADLRNKVSAKLADIVGPALGREGEYVFLGRKVGRMPACIGFSGMLRAVTVFDRLHATAFGARCARPDRRSNAGL